MWLQALRPPSPPALTTLNGTPSSPLLAMELASARAERSRPPPGGVPAMISIARSGFQVIGSSSYGPTPSRARHGEFAGFIDPSTLAQRSTSLRMKSSNAAGERCCGGTTSYPRSANRLTTVGSSMAADSARLSFSTMGAGVPLGADRPYQTVSLKSGNPASAVVGTLGSIGERVAPVTA